MTESVHGPWCWGQRRAAPWPRQTPASGGHLAPERDTEHITEPGTERGTEHITEHLTEPGTERDTEQSTEPVTKPGTAEWPQRPPYSYVALITMAIRASPEQRLPLSSIYAYIAERFPFYRDRSRHWQNSVRHNLSLNPCFRRLPRHYGRAGDWELHPAFHNMFPEGNYLLRRRHCRHPSASPPQPSGIPAATRAPPPSGMAGMASLPAALWAPPPSGIPPGPAEPRPPLLPEARPGPAAPWPPPPCAVPALPARGPPVPLPARGPPVPLPAWALRPAEPDAALTAELGARLAPAFR
ncbi:forkhead box protein E3-like [Hirundo rustica]|uniref:forkhead box protein E3-like n=1 Tax=Hirundo rustica TaxID=43150 RepID=UPI001A94BBE2|nr:forkhead box protein E3-like [Hirundo rustica]